MQKAQACIQYDRDLGFFYAVVTSLD